MNTKTARGGAESVLALLTATTALAQPVITAEPRTQFQWENRQVVLEVRQKGKTPFAYQWQFNGADIPGATNRFYTMPRAQTTNEGNYLVLVTDTTGTTTSQVARVMVRGWPKPTGPFIPELARLDTNLMNIMLAHNVPGGSLAVVKDGRLVLARGYGFADVENREPFQPDSLCRAASLSKTITAATAMKLVEEGKVDLDAPVLPILGLEPPDYPEAAFDSRWTNVTLRHCLNHTGGWNKDTAKDPLGAVGFQPVWWPNQVAKDLGLQSTANMVDMVRWMLGKPMQFSPGTAFVYSNFGYVVAGALIEKIVGVPYERAARALLSKSGITRTHVAGDARTDRELGETVYYLHPSATSDWARVESEPRPFDFELPYAWPVSFHASAGGWVTSTIDYARFVASIDGNSAYPDTLRTNTIASMVARPKISPVSDTSYYAFGVRVTPATGLWHHTGEDIGWRTLWVKTRGGVILVFTMNTEWIADDGFDLWSSFSPILDGIRQWPTHDLFPNTLSYEAWETKHFGDPRAAALGYGSDPDRDGVPNLVEYSQGTDPIVASGRPPLTVTAERTDGKLTLSIGYRRLLLAHEIDYLLETSEDLKSWSLVSGETSQPSLNPDGTVTGMTRVGTPEDTRARFYRMVVVRKQS